MELIILILILGCYRIVLRLRMDRNGASLDTATCVMASFREANPNAIMPNFAVDEPSLQAVEDFAAALAMAMYPPPR